MFRSLRAILLLSRILASYGWQWLLVRITWGRGFSKRWDRVHRRNARRLRDGFARLRGVFIKLGQMISVVGGFLPEDYRLEMSTLQDRVPPRPFDEIRARLQEAFGARAIERYATFELEPVASASLSQVHRATLPSGRQVAVKVLYPGIEQLIATDMATIRWLLPVLKRLLPLQGLHRVEKQLREMLQRETDYENERRNIEKMREVFAKREDVVVPEVIAELSAASVLTMTYEAGCRLTDRQALEQGEISRDGLATLLTDCYLSMVFQHGLFHADPHPGNFLARPGPRLVILDYGAVETVSEDLVEGMRMAGVGALTRDSDRVLDGIEKMGFVAPHGDRELLREAGHQYLHALARLQIEDYDQVDPRRIREATGHDFSAARRLMRHVQYPEGFFYVERTLGLLFGLVAQLSPKKGLPGVAAPLLSKHLLRQLAARPAERRQA